MRAIAVVVVNELLQDRAQVEFAERYQVVEALAADSPHPALGDRVGPWCLNRRRNARDAKSGAAPAEIPAPDAIAVMDQVVRPAVPGRGFDQLPPDPGGAGMGGHLEVNELTTAVADEEEDVEGPEGEGLNDNEVGPTDRLSLVSKEGFASSGWAGGNDADGGSGGSSGS